MSAVPASATRNWLYWLMMHIALSRKLVEEELSHLKMLDFLNFFLEFLLRWIF